MVQRVIELIKATKYKGNSAMPRQEFLMGLITAVQALPDDEWEKLSEEAQLWSNAATAAKRRHEPISDPGNGVARNGFDIDEGEESHVKHKTIKRAKSGRAVKAGLSQTAARAGKKINHTSYSDVLFQTIWDDPKISKDELMRRIKKAGYNPVSWTVSAYSTRFRQAWKFFKRIGAIKRDIG